MGAYRTVGDLTITGAVRSTATDIEGVIAEIAAATVSERGETRADDAGVVALASLVSPLNSDGEIARALNDAARLRSSRFTWPRRARNANAVTPRGCTPGRERASSRASPVSTHPLSRPRIPIWCWTRP